MGVLLLGASGGLLAACTIRLVQRNGTVLLYTFTDETMNI